MSLARTLRSFPIRSLIYAAFATVFAYSLYYDVRFQPRLGHKWYLYKAVMLTNANLILVTTYAILQLLNSIIVNKRLQSHLDFAYFIAVFPVGFITVFMFWCLYFFDPEFVMPEWIRNLIPEWLNQVTHTLPLVFSVTDVFITKHKRPSWKTLAAFSFLLTFGYLGVVFGVRYFEGQWLYPIFDLLNTEWWIVVIISVVFLYLLVISFTVVLNFIFWGKQQSETPSKKKKKY